MQTGNLADFAINQEPRCPVVLLFDVWSTDPTAIAECDRIPVYNFPPHEIEGLWSRGQIA